MPKEFLQRVIGCIAKAQRIPTETMKAESTFEQLGIDSLDGINILFALESEFDIEIPDNAAQQVKTVGDMANGVFALVEQKQRVQA